MEQKQNGSGIDHEATQQETHGRRDFLKKAGKAAVAAPALALILKAEKSHAWGRDLYGGRDCDYRSGTHQTTFSNFYSYFSKYF